MSAKKDNLVNIGGWLAVNDRQLYEELAIWSWYTKGLHTYGGMAGRDMEALAIGIEECVQDDHIRSRVGQVRYLGDLLTDWDIPIVHPVGGHAVFLDAAAHSTRTSRKTSFPPRPWRPDCISTPAFARWSAGSPAPGATRDRAITTAPGSS